MVFLPLWHCLNFFRMFISYQIQNWAWSYYILHNDILTFIQTTNIIFVLIVQ